MHSAMESRASTETPAGNCGPERAPLHGRVLVVADSPAQDLLSLIFRERELSAWEPSIADSFEQARFRLQHEHWDALLLDESLLPLHDSEGLAWLGSQREVPVVLLTSPDSDLIARALEAGVQQWLPRDLALQSPAVLAAALGQSARLADVWRASVVAGKELRESRRQVGRLVNRLWEVAHTGAGVRWHSQRYLLERLQEEIGRADRHGEMVSVVVGEVLPQAGETADQPLLGKWAAEQLAHSKRRCDLAGHYGLHGFMLILVHTGEPGAVQCCHRLRGLLEKSPAPYLGPVRAHFGVATFSRDAATPKALLSRAESRLEQAKASPTE